ncbi:unnamed protein product [Prunus armeniaca]
MPFGLKNAGATYQHLVNKIFAELIGTSMEVYVDDMLVESRTANDHLRNLSLMFGTLKKYNMRLIPNKYAFGVSTGKFLGFMISQRDKEGCSEPHWPSHGLGPLHIQSHRPMRPLLQSSQRE